MRDGSSGRCWDRFSASLILFLRDLTYPIISDYNYLRYNDYIVGTHRLRFCIKPKHIMAELTGFQTASQSEIESANKLNTLSRGTSPFQQGVAFTVSGFSYEKAEIDGKVAADAKPQPVLVTSIGSLFVKPLNRNAVKADGSVLEHKGTFNAFVRETIASNPTKNDGQLLQLIVDGCQGKTLLVDRIPYSAKSKDGRTYATSMVDINFKVD